MLPGALEAAAQVVLSEAQWRHVDDVLAAFVPDFGREQSDAERGELIKAVTPDRLLRNSKLLHPTNCVSLYSRHRTEHSLSR